MQISFKTIIALFIVLLVPVCIVIIWLFYKIAPFKMVNNTDLIIILFIVSFVIAALFTKVIIEWYKSLYRNRINSAIISISSILILAGLASFSITSATISELLENLAKNFFPEFELPNAYLFVFTGIFLILIGSDLLSKLLKNNAPTSSNNKTTSPTNKVIKKTFSIQQVIKELIEKKTSVHLYRKNPDLPWQEKLNQIIASLQEQHIPIAQIDLQQGKTVVLKNFLQEIITQLNIGQTLDDQDIFGSFQTILEQQGGNHYLVLKRFDFISHYFDFEEQKIELFATLRQLIMENKHTKLVLITIAKKPFTELLPQDNPLSIINNVTFQLR